MYSTIDVFWRAAKNSRVNFKTTNPTTLPVSEKKQRRKKICAKKKAVNFKVRAKKVPLAKRVPISKRTLRAWY